MIWIKASQNRKGYNKNEPSERRWVMKSAIIQLEVLTRLSCMQKIESAAKSVGVVQDSVNDVQCQQGKTQLDEATVSLRTLKRIAKAGYEVQKSSVK